MGGKYNYKEVVLGLVVFLIAYLFMVHPIAWGKPAGSRVFLLGVDGLTWSVLKEEMEKGKLKNFAFLIEKGASGKLQSINPTASPPVWTTIATGKLRAKHGITWFQLPGEEGELVLASSTHRKVKAIWNILSKQNKKVGVIGYYVTWPAEKVNGIMITERTFFPIEGGVYPPGLERVIEKDIGRYYIGGLPKFNRETELNEQLKLLEGKRSQLFFDTFEQLGDNLINGFSVLLHQHKKDGRQSRRLASFLVDHPRINTILYYYFYKDNFRFRMAQQLFENDYDFFSLYLKGVDVASHKAWKYYKPSPEYPVDKQELAIYKDAIPNYYAFVDRVIGYFLAKLDPDTVFMVVSDHGFKKARKRFMFDINKMLNKMGYLDYDEERNIKQNKMYDNTIYWLSFYSDREIVVNLPNLFPSRPPREDRILLAKVISQLQGIKVGRLPFFQSVKLKKEKAPKERTYLLEAKINKAFFSPEYIRGHQNFPKEVKIGGKKYPMREFFSFSENSGDHLIDGVFIAYGNGIKENFNARDIGILDVTPTILKIMDLPLAEDMRGRPALAILTDKFRKSLSKKTIASYETPGKREKRKIKKSGVDEAIKEKLKALGYIQ